MSLEYTFVSGAPGPAFDAAVQAQIDAGFAPIGVPYVSGPNLEQVMIRGSMTSMVPAYLITAVIIGAGGTFSIAGNRTSDFNVGFKFTVTGSTGNDGVYTVATSTYVGPDTDIVVIPADDILDGTVDGTILAYSA
jgi:hypothetical protein